MSDKASDQEPSIEEILSSIRQIISDDDEELDNGVPEKKAVVEDPVRHKNNDVMELTEEDLIDAEEDEYPEVDPFEDDVELDMVDRAEPEEEPFEPEEEAEPTPPPKSKIEIDEELSRIRSQEVGREEPDPTISAPAVPSEILSTAAQSAAMNSLSKLSRQMPVHNSRSYDGITLEDIVRESLHPMLREWMDQHLPPMVERIVQKELEKLARRAFDD